MQRQLWSLVAFTLIGGIASAQEEFIDGGEFLGAASVGSNEQLFSYDDQENWKHGYIKVMPYYHGFQTFRPYNYHHVFGQTTTAQGFGMSPVMPYSQQFWHRYEKMADLSQGNHEPVYPSIPPVEENDHYPKPIGPTPTDRQPLPGQPSASLLAPPFQGYPQAVQMPYIPQPRPQYAAPNDLYGSQIAPVQYRDNAPYQGFAPNVGRPGLPAPGLAY